ncbi:major capsid protein [Novosphingobium sp. RL4]|uniref:major capsid protein n=1 Tax=Novosphingobium sp. RL4 TaxID=3109595 RepID=UPI002D7894E5|nr:major capsid protein [Novosphingobium sp. RL4]WRT91912.1 major capsid protein [Novosphingobium sp. RL4]
MAGMDVFNSSAFSMTSLTGAVDKMDFNPQLLGQLGLFDAMPVNTRDIWVDRRGATLALIPSSPVGAPPAELVRDNRDAVPLKTTRLAKGFTIYAEEVQGIRAFGSQTELQSVQGEYLRRMQRIRNDMELTHEFHRLGALQGLLLDADGSTVIYNYYTAFGVTQPSAVSFALNVDTTDVRGKCAQIIRSMKRASKGAFTPATKVHALVGDAFYDALINHPQVRETYLNWSAAADLRGNNSFGDFEYGGITWHNYQGTDDNSTVAVGVDNAIFFPVGAQDVFKKAMAPAEFGPYVNTPGQDIYALNIPDLQRAAWSRGELYSYPLYFNQRPDLIARGTRT